MIVSLGEDAVGSGVGVDVGSGVRVAVTVAGAEDDPLFVEQAITRNIVMRNTGRDLFIWDM